MQCQPFYESDSLRCKDWSSGFWCHCFMLEVWRSCIFYSPFSHTKSAFCDLIWTLLSFSPQPLLECVKALSTCALICSKSGNSCSLSLTRMYTFFKGHAWRQIVKADWFPLGPAKERKTVFSWYQSWTWNIGSFKTMIVYFQFTDNFFLTA